MDNLDYYNLLIETDPSIERKGKTTPYTSINGHMFSFFSKDDKVGLRLSKNDLNEFVQKFDAKIMIQHGRTMKEFVEVPSNVLMNVELMSTYLQKSLQYVSSLRPKPSKKKN